MVFAYISSFRLDDGYVFCGKVASELQYLKVDEVIEFDIIKR